MARVLITTIREPEIIGETLRTAFRYVFFGAEVQRFDATTSTVDFTPDMTGAQAKAAVRAAIQGEATRLGYGTIQRMQHIDEVFHGL